MILFADITHNSYNNKNSNTPKPKILDSLHTKFYALKAHINFQSPNHLSISLMNTLDLESVTEDTVEDHVFDVVISHAPSEKSDLGVYERKDGSIKIDIKVFNPHKKPNTSARSSRKEKSNNHLKKSIVPNISNQKGQLVSFDYISLDIQQSISLFTSKQETSTTGAMVWRVSVFFTEWLLNIANGYIVDEDLEIESWKINGIQIDSSATIAQLPKLNLFSQPLQSWDVIELGCGIGGLAAAAIGPQVNSYIATDHLTSIIKTANLNVQNNNDKSITNIHCMEYDWETPSLGIEELQRVFGLNGDNNESRPLIILALDTVFNEFLIPHFLNAIVALAKTLRPRNAHVIIGQQVRDPEIMESFMSQFVRRAHDDGSKCFDVWAVPDRFLTERLINGYTVHYANFIPSPKTE